MFFLKMHSLASGVCVRMCDCVAVCRESEINHLCGDTLKKDLENVNVIVMLYFVPLFG